MTASSTSVKTNARFIENASHQMHRQYEMLCDGSFSGPRRRRSEDRVSGKVNVRSTRTGCANRLGKVIARGYRGPGSGTNPVLLLALVLLVVYFLSGSLQSPIQNAARDPIAFVAFIVAIVLGITVHEFMHAYAAHRLGDDTGRLMGRMTLNPMAHFA